MDFENTKYRTLISKTHLENFHYTELPKMDRWMDEQIYGLDRQTDRQEGRQPGRQITYTGHIRLSTWLLYRLL
jgi:hypothetical protein